MKTVTFQYDQGVFSPRSLVGKAGQTRQLSPDDARRLADLGYGRIVEGTEPSSDQTSTNKEATHAE
jgi:hypothetical protein